MEQLPQDVLLNIFTVLPTRDILSLGCTCRELANSTIDDRFWRSRFFAEYRPRAPFNNSPTVEPTLYVYRHQSNPPNSWRELYIRREEIFFKLSRSEFGILKDELVLMDVLAMIEENPKTATMFLASVDIFTGLIAIQVSHPNFLWAKLCGDILGLHSLTLPEDWKATIKQIADANYFTELTSPNLDNALIASYLLSMTAVRETLSEVMPLSVLKGQQPSRQEIEYLSGDWLAIICELSFDPPGATLRGIVRLKMTFSHNSNLLIPTTTVPEGTIDWARGYMKFVMNGTPAEGMFVPTGISGYIGARNFLSLQNSFLLLRDRRSSQLFDAVKDLIRVDNEH
eukprot:TRINITY_DN380_c0_g2_i3.p1 TRINITY_DN380_c0_g2~~TRINITY_DN380_c0_g2_i3.p1  ORF type:complete len:374 (-),score=83.86 TRINITY_DN380_c0_g2_i3:61-1083(-)